MKLIIDIDEGDYKWIKNHVYTINEQRIANGTPLPKYAEELKRKLFMKVDGGTDDKYLRYADVCDRISNTIDTYINAESEDRE